MNYSDITTIASVLQKRYEQLCEELDEYDEKQIQAVGGYDALNKMSNEERTEKVYNDEWHRIVKERNSVCQAMEHFKEYIF